MPAEQLLYVEGTDDRHTIHHLLRRHGIDFALDQIKIAGKIDWADDAGGKEELLKAIEAQVPIAIGGTIGFILDANTPLAGRWQAVRGRLQKVGLKAPETPDPAGFVGESAESKCRVGVWLMPDNQQNGDLETFLHELIAQDDPLIDHATASTGEAVVLGAKFPSVHRRKADLHCWLAWQQEPGRPYGTALSAHYFGKDSPAALAFVDWFKRLFGV